MTKKERELPRRYNQEHGIGNILLFILNFHYFLIGLYIQISEGQTINGSKFKATSAITTIDLEFMEEF